MGSGRRSRHPRSSSSCTATAMAPKFRKIKQELEAKFGDKVEVTGEGTPETTGYLEVEDVGCAVLHSKKGGDGYVDTSEKMNKIFAVSRRLLPNKPTCCKRDLNWSGSYDGATKKIPCLLPFKQYANTDSTNAHESHPVHRVRSVLPSIFSFQ